MGVVALMGAVAAVSAPVIVPVVPPIPELRGPDKIWSTSVEVASKPILRIASSTGLVPVAVPVASGETPPCGVINSLAISPGPAPGPARNCAPVTVVGPTEASLIIGAPVKESVTGST